MKLEIKISTLIVFIICQTFFAVLFYLEDKYIDGMESIFIFALSIPFTVFVQWLRDEFNFFDKSDSN